MTIVRKIRVYFILSAFSAVFFLISNRLEAQERMDLSGGWKCKNISEVAVDGLKVSDPGFSLKG